VQIFLFIPVYQQIRDSRLKQDSGLKCHQENASDKTVNGLKSDAENKTETGDSSDIKFSKAAEADLSAHQPEPVSSELVSERMWEDVSDASEISNFSSCSDLSPLPATTTVTVVGNGLIQVSPADPLIRRLSLGSDESKMNSKTDDDLYKHRYLWSTCDQVVTEQEWEQDLGLSPTDVDGHPQQLVQLQNILPLFIFGMNNDGSRSMQLAVIGDHRLNSDYLSSPQADGPITTSVAPTDCLPRNNHLLQKSTSGQVF